MIKSQRNHVKLMIVLLHCLMFSAFCKYLYQYVWVDLVSMNTILCPVNSWSSEARPLHTGSILYQVWSFSERNLWHQTHLPHTFYTGNLSQPKPCTPAPFLTFGPDLLTRRTLYTKRFGDTSKYKKILWRYKSTLSRYRVTFGTLARNSGSRNPVPRTSSVQTSGTEPNPWEPIEHRNLRNLGLATFWTRNNASGPEPYFREPVPETEPGTRFLPTAPARPEHTEIYIVQRPHSILLLGKKYSRKQTSTKTNQARITRLA